MPKRNIEFFVIDMLLSIDRINRYSSSLATVNDFICDETAFNVILRDLALIGEAMNHILQAKKLKNLIKPAWREIVAFRNIVIHEYFGVSYSEVFEIIKEEVPKLEKELLRFLKDFEDKEAMCKVLTSTKIELKEMGRDKSLEYLDKIDLCLKK